MDYKRFVSYVYEYQNGRKRDNCGFVKIEIQSGKCKIETHIRCKKNLGGIKCKIYAFVRKNGLQNGILIGSYAPFWDKLETILETEQDDVGRMGVAFEKIGGLIFITERGEFFGTEWDDFQIKPDFFREMKMQEKIEEKTEEKIQVMEITPILDNEKKEDFFDEFEEFFPFEEGDEDCFEKCWKITQTDLSKISEECCRLRFNRFLLYGFHGMGHLLFALRKDGHFVLGVPGIFDQQESFMAGMFGFPYFIESAKVCIPDKKGGYWYRIISQVEKEYKA